MNRLKSALIALWTADEGLTTVEYAVAGALITLAVVGAFQLLGGTVDTVIRGINTAITPAA